ncbi:MAG: hypothetical protein LBL39_07595 [Planctomycetaceae bacterium]|jgi:hypothetical protein|nr:hypothetical protein [Planctomycetaceae bacterium]
MKKSKKKSNHYVRSFLIFVAVFVVCCVSLWVLIRHDIEVNYCLNGGHFELSMNSRHFTSIINRDEYITFDLNKPFPIQISAQLPEISNISFDDYDKLVINTIYDFYTVDGQLIFRGIETDIMTRSQLESFQCENRLDSDRMQILFSKRNIMIKINRNNNDTSNNKSIMVVSVENDNGQWIEIGAVEINTDVVEIRGSIETRMSGSASTFCKSTLITGISSEGLHDGSYNYFGKYILLKSF